MAAEAESRPTVRVQLSYEMSKLLGSERLEVAGATTVADAIQIAQARFPDPDAFRELSARTAIAVNGVLTSHRRGLRTQLKDGDTVTFVKAAAGG